MKVVFNCTIHKFHREYCDSIADEVRSRGYDAIYAEGSRNEGSFEADFCIQPDQICHRLGARIGIWIGHALPVIPQNRFYLEDEFETSLKLNSDYIFTFSQEWVHWHQIYGLPTYSVGLPKLDGYFDKIAGGSILYAPTHHLKPGVYSKNHVNLERLAKYGRPVIFRGHPVFRPKQEPSMESLKRASIVISDYSSIGLEAIILNIPTILIGNEKWRGLQSIHISHRADQAAIRVYSQAELEQAIEVYLENPRYLEAERLRYSELLCEYQGRSAAQFVDTLEQILVTHAPRNVACALA